MPLSTQYKMGLPPGYEYNMGQKGKRKLGVIGKEERFKKYWGREPGPGAYDTHLYKSLNKLDFSILAISSQPNSPTKSLSPFSFK